MPYNRIVISSGHGKYVAGASGAAHGGLVEVDEARKVVNRVAEELRNRGVEVVTYHDDTSRNVSDNLNAIVNAHNRENRQLDVSVHFNAFDKTANGTEVCYVTQKDLAAKLSAAIATAGGFKNRGGKHRTDLKFLNATSQPAVLLEMCFCDNVSDSNKYRVEFDAICDAIADVLGGKEETEKPEPPDLPDEVAVAEVTIRVTAPPNVKVNFEVEESGS